MGIRFFAGFLFFCCLNAANAQEDFGISVPEFKDEYSATVKNLEAGQLDIDFLKFRESYLESEQFNIAGNKSEVFDSLRKTLSPLIKKKDVQGVIRTCKAMLSIDYTYMEGHKLLQQSYKNMGDTVNSKKYKEIEFGLLRSIVKNGDGKTCATAWPVIKVEEEYFILDILDAELIQQSVNHDGGVCDRMEVKINGKKEVYYFDVKRVFAQYKKMFKED